jgi:hypothetical protein
MKKYFVKKEQGEQGPFTAAELAALPVSGPTEVREEGSETWQAASTVEELKSIFNPQPEKVAEPVAATTVTAPATPKSTTIPVPASSAAPAVNGLPWLSWVLGILLIGATGYYVYQDMEKNKTAGVQTVENDADKTEPGKDEKSNDQQTVPVTTNTTDHQPDTTASPDNTPPVTDGNVNVVPVTTVSPSDPAKTAADKKKKAEEKKKADDKKKQLAAEEKKRLAAQALAAKEREMRTNWSSYIGVSAFNYKEDDGIKPFTIPVFNQTGYPLDQVILRVDYLKKEGKFVKSETLVLYNVGASGIVQAEGNKKAKKANVYITTINSHSLHFCYPVNSGIPGDPYYCR